MNVFTLWLAAVESWFTGWWPRPQSEPAHWLTLPPPWATIVPRSSTSSTRARKTLQGEDGVVGRAWGLGRQPSRDPGSKHTGPVPWEVGGQPEAWVWEQWLLGRQEVACATSPGQQLPTGVGQQWAFSLHHARQGRHHARRQQLLHPSPHKTRLVLGKEATQREAWTVRHSQHKAGNWLWHGCGCQGLKRSTHLRVLLGHVLLGILGQLHHLGVRFLIVIAVGTVDQGRGYGKQHRPFFGLAGQRSCESVGAAQSTFYLWQPTWTQVEARGPPHPKSRLWKSMNVTPRVLTS